MICHLMINTRVLEYDTINFSVCFTVLKYLYNLFLCHVLHFFATHNQHK